MKDYYDTVFGVLFMKMDVEAVRSQKRSSEIYSRILYTWYEFYKAVREDG